jgi:transcriptional regulator with XRE-family HTH domain
MGKPCERLAEARAARHESAEAFAKAVGVSPHTYRMHERGDRRLTMDHARRYGEALGVSAHWIMTGEEQPGLTEAEREALRLARSLPDDLRAAWFATGKALEAGRQPPQRNGQASRRERIA